MMRTPLTEVSKVIAPQASLCWSRATRMMHMFVVGEKYLMVSDMPTAPHPVSPKLDITLCRTAE